MLLRRPDLKVRLQEGILDGVVAHVANPHVINDMGEIVR
jgi:hypothetical protein